ncbi:hypothetical protein EXIGLDRAFT_770033 [Exidia glandulosa HHB12029]|uniref:Uncharacterized protein n=1 Tax=Exidia glandulosa HHB12029 TaxID=1314781 RepID=A0A165H1F9_EXIGL|nr:hypothetical protein EXIGLDRAFT_770033 [Exidia glandulosa HHB12029]
MEIDSRCSYISLITSAVLILTGAYEPLLKRRPEPTLEPVQPQSSTLLDELAYNVKNIPGYGSYNTKWYPTATGYERLPEPPREPLIKLLLNLTVAIARDLRVYWTDRFDLTNDTTVRFAGYFLLSILFIISFAWTYTRLCGCNASGESLMRAVKTRIGPRLRSATLESSLGHVWKSLYPRMGSLALNLVAALWCYFDSNEDWRILRELVLLLLVFPISTQDNYSPLQRARHILAFTREDFMRRNRTIWQHYIIPDVQWLVRRLPVTIRAALCTALGGRLVPETPPPVRPIVIEFAVNWRDTDGRIRTLKVKGELFDNDTPSESYCLTVHSNSCEIMDGLGDHLYEARDELIARESQRLREQAASNARARADATRTASDGRDDRSVSGSSESETAVEPPPTYAGYDL